MTDNSTGPIGVFDSGYGGLTVFGAIEQALPQYDYIYLGDNARAPYGSRSFSTVYEYTWQAVQWFFKQGCPLVILACNTASAKALRSIQQVNLPVCSNPANRVLGVIRPTAEVIGRYTQTGHIGVLGTAGTVRSQSYCLEITKFWPQITVHQQACPMWVPLIENNEHQSPGADYFIDLYLNQLFAQQADIDTLLLACTHYPLLQQAIEQRLTNRKIQVLGQGGIVASSLVNYLSRHKEMEVRITKRAQRLFFTTDDASDFEKHAALFLGKPVNAVTVHL
jgi:glutamate racemase